MSNSNYSAFQEREILIQDGLEYSITSISELYQADIEQTIICVQLVYPPVSQ